MTTTSAVPRGLAGVVVTDTALGDVRGREGFYHYRQYSAIELARTRSFEDVWYLMFHGELPGRAAAADFAARTARLRTPPRRGARGAARHRPRGRRLRPARRTPYCACLPPAPPPDTARSTTSTPTAAARDALAACAAVPTILTALQRLGQGLEPVEPREDLPYAANYLYMLTGSEPEPDRVRPSSST
ncbi:Citrate synthase OS=Streptomyces microflavus OX=1919 GN=Smic_63120 PE=3 SV=1 [Streptomyces microflavus]